MRVCARVLCSVSVAALKIAADKALVGGSYVTQKYDNSGRCKPAPEQAAHSQHWRAGKGYCM